MPRAYLLDLTRLTSRLGRGALTGIDRVEAAYLAHFLAQNFPLYGLIRTKWGYLLLDMPACTALNGFIHTGAVPDLPFWLRPFATPAARGVMAMRPLACARQPSIFLGAVLRRIPQGAIYVNVGHSNLSAPMLAAAKTAGLRVCVMIHDTIPLDFPQFVRQGQVQPFQDKIRATALTADHVIHISHDARLKTEAYFANAGRVPHGITAHLGVTLAAPTPTPIVPQRPYFVALGTIEPRKNLHLLLDIWQNIPADGPQLVVIGAKGWADSALFAQMAHLQAKGAVLHGENLPDGAVSTLLQGAIALLFPSLAEGFGLPPCEAAGWGVPVVASNLPVLHETCGEFPVYLNPSDSYSWMETIQRLAQVARLGQGDRKQRALPTWADHFKAVLTQLD